MENIELFITTVFMGFFAMTNPIGNAAVFISYTKSLTDQQKKAIAFKSILVSFIIIVMFTMLGEFIFSFFDITLPAFRIMGGLLLMISGYKVLTSNPKKDSSTDTETDPNSIAISPLAFPMIAGPGTISSAINFTGVYKGYLDSILILAIFLIICILIYLVFTNASKVLKFIGDSTIEVISKLMGLIIAVIGTQMIISGVSAAFNIYTK